MNLPKTTGIILLDGPERPEELLAPSKRFIKSPKSSPKSLSPVSSPTNSINSPSSSRLKSSVRTSFWDGKKKVDDLSTPTKPSPPPTKNINKMNGKFQSPKVNMIVNNNNEDEKTTTTSQEKVKKTSTSKKKRRHRRSSIVHLGSVGGAIDDHHRVNELYKQITGLLEANEGQLIKPEQDDEDVLENNNNNNKNNNGGERKKSHRSRETILLAHDDAHDILHALNEFKAMLSIGSFNVHDPDHVEAKTVSHIVGEYSSRKKKFQVKDTWKRAMSKIAIIKQRETLGVNLQDTIFQALGNIHQHIPLKLTDENLKRMEGCGNWNFDILHLADDLGEHTLPTVAHVCFDELRKRNFGSNDVQYDTQVLVDYMGEIESLYKDENTYHNANHGADVGHTVFVCLARFGWGDHMKAIEVFAAVVAAFVHDVGHTGVNNNYLVQTGHTLALRFNDQSPLENMHVAIAFEAMKEKGCNLIAKFSNSEQKRYRKILIDTVLGTDNALHFEHVLKLKEEIVKSKNKKQEHKFSIHDEPKRHFILSLVLHMADLSNPAKPLPIYLRWCDLVIEEFQSLGDKEKEAGLPVGHIFKRDTPLHEIQLGFVNFLVKPFYKQMNDIEGVDISDILSLIDKNLEHFQKMKTKVEQDQEEVDVIFTKD